MTHQAEARAGKDVEWTKLGKPEPTADRAKRHAKTHLERFRVELADRVHYRILQLDSSGCYFPVVAFEAFPPHKQRIRWHWVNRV